MKENIVKQIIEEIKSDGDKAINKYSLRFDKENFFEVSREQIEDAYNKIDKNMIITIKKAVENIRLFAKEQMKYVMGFETIIKGNILGQKIIPLKRVGCYVPGGRYPLFSSALMSVIPAKIAGVEEVIVCSPKINIYTIVAANLAGANKIYSLGGVQAIAAMAYGSESIPKVDKIVGPGNAYVTEAKKQVYGDVGIDFIAGPSEVMVIADENAKSDYIAADLLAQAEHDPDAGTYLISNSKALVEKVKLELKKQIKFLKTQDVAIISIRNLEIILINNIEESIEIANKIAPEHLELQIKNSEKLVDKLKNYGSLFIGKYSAEVFGDYCSGTNHILPTNGTARYTGGLSVNDFVKRLTYQEITKQGKKELIEISSALAEIEGLDAHKKSAKIRN